VVETPVETVDDDLVVLCVADVLAVDEAVDSVEPDVSVVVC